MRCQTKAKDTKRIVVLKMECLQYLRNRFGHYVATFREFSGGC